MDTYDELWEALTPDRITVSLTAVVRPTGRIERLEVSGRSPVTGEILDCEVPPLLGDISYLDLTRAAQFWVLLLDGNTIDF